MNTLNNNEKYFYEEALKEAFLAYNKNEVPIGCVIVHNNKIISRAHNIKETNSNSLHHAEILAIEEACKKLNTWRLNECTIYTTLEPCMMCTGAIANSRINNIYVGIKNDKMGFLSKAFEKESKNKYNIHYINDSITKDLLQNFFKALRLKKNKNLL